jgi:hypothetical protein
MSSVFGKIIGLLPAAIWLLILGGVNVNAAEKNCDGIKRRVFSASPADSATVLKELEPLLRKEEPCAKNFLGRLHFEGKIIEKDHEKAHAIFFDLSQRGYPPAMYNLAYFFIQKKDTPPDEIITFLHGLIAQFSGHSEWGYIAANSRELGWDYLESIMVSERNDEMILALRERHKIVSERATDQLAESVKAKSHAVREQSGTIIAVISAGVMISSVVGAAGNSALPARSITSNSPSSFASSPRLYQLIPTGNSNVLYTLPLN